MQSNPIISEFIFEYRLYYKNIYGINRGYSKQFSLAFFNRRIYLLEWSLPARGSTVNLGSLIDVEWYISYGPKRIHIQLWTSTTIPMKLNCKVNIVLCMFKNKTTTKSHNFVLPTSTRVETTVNQHDKIFWYFLTCAHIALSFKKFTFSWRLFVVAHIVLNFANKKQIIKLRDFFFN